MANKVTPDWAPEYGEGWNVLVNTLVSKLYALDPNMEIIQIKEKFGGLRVYIEPSNRDDKNIRQQFNDLIDEAESRSYTICENCGQAGRTRNDLGWVRTLCDADYEQAVYLRDNRVRIAAEQKAKAEREREEKKTYTVCEECGDKGHWRKDITESTHDSRVLVLCDEHHQAFWEEIEERKRNALAKRAEYLAQREAERQLLEENRKK